MLFHQLMVIFIFFIYGRSTEFINDKINSSFLITNLRIEKAISRLSLDPFKVIAINFVGGLGFRGFTLILRVCV